MEKLNIAELLKDCPTGMELDCTMFEGLEFDGIAGTYFPIRCRVKCPDGGYNIYNFTEYGSWHDTDFSKCVIFPKGKTTWDGFHRPFKDGDILTYNNTVGKTIFIHRNKNGEHTYKTSFYVGINARDKLLVYNKCTLIALNGDCDTRLSTEEEKEKLFKAIKDNGYKWNEETKALEKLSHPKFKVGDKVESIFNKNQYIITELTDAHYVLVEVNHKFRYVEPIIEDKNWKLVIEPKFKVGDRIKYIYLDRKVAKVVKIHDKRYELDNGEFIEFQDENAYEISYEKFDISTLKSFDKVLVAHEKGEWHIQFFEKYSPTSKFPFICIGGSVYQKCVPYEENIHLMGTTSDCDGYYKIWE